MLQALQAADLIRREPDPADARRKCIVCTEKAEAFRPACLQGMPETEAMLLRGIWPEEAGRRLYADRAENAFKF